MTNARNRRLLAIGLTGFVLVGAAACSSSDDSSEKTEAKTSTTKKSTDTTKKKSTDTTKKPTNTTSAGSEDEAIEATDSSWSATAGEYEGKLGKRVRFDCTPGGTVGSVWGTGTYTNDSSVCTAGVHAGAITVEDGGTVIITITKGEESYEGTEANGITSSSYASWGGSFTVED